MAEPIRVQLDDAPPILSRDACVQRLGSGWRIKLRPPYYHHFDTDDAGLRRLLDNTQLADGDDTISARARGAGCFIATQYQVDGRTITLSRKELECLRRSVKLEHVAMLEAENTLLYLLARENPLPQPICELGSLYGASAIALALGARNSRYGNRVIAVDDHEWHKHLPSGSVAPELVAALPTTLELFHHNLSAARVLDLVDVKVQDTARAGQEHDGDLSMLFFDAGHEREEVARDAAAWLDKVVPGGLVAFHDYGSPLWPDVKLIVDDLKPRFRSFCSCHELAIGIMD